MGPVTGVSPGLSVLIADRLEQAPLAGRLLSGENRGHKKTLLFPLPARN